MQSIRTSVSHKFSNAQPSLFWTNVRTTALALIEANAGAFEAFARTGQPFGGNVARR